MLHYSLSLSRFWLLHYQQHFIILVINIMGFSTKTITLIFLLVSICYCCPSICNCTSKTLSCSVCLSHYFQIYNATSQMCQCRASFDFYRGGGDYCCPVTCDKCYRNGCATCISNATIALNETLKYYDCVCKQNFIRNEFKKCICQSEIYPDKYYFDPLLSECFKCPDDCVCNRSGCVQCAGTANRTISYADTSLVICSCKDVLVDVDGVCSCYEGCVCENNTVVQCSSESMRFQNYSSWDCLSPYVETSNYCQCAEPYTMLDIFGNQQCVCKSKQNYTHYYQVNSKCRKCSQTCFCDNRGCVACNNPLWQYLNFQCFCSVGSTEVNGQCMCLTPYYNSGTTGNCSCLSDLFPLEYIYYDSLRLCFVCPAECTCTESGCIQCTQQSLRQILQLPDNKKTCGCVATANEIAGKCVCKSDFYYDNQTKSCKCQNIMFPTQTYLEQSKCKKCPLFCSCNASGCYSCQQTALRAIVTQNGVSSCLCIGRMFERNGECVCPTGSSFDHRSRRCECYQPYYTVVNANNQNECHCLSEIDPKHFYIDPVTTICQECPLGCSCDPRGCFDCDPLTMRFIQIDVRAITTYSQCPCLQNSYSVNGTCTICSPNSYYNGQGCTLCNDCLTCNRYGCTSCAADMTLDNITCKCNNANLTNINGFCICPKSQYMNTFLSTNESFMCVACPKNCYTCTIFDQLIKCTSCNINSTNRMDLHQSDCLCRPGYTEAPIKEIYCCPRYCENCNSTDCLICPLYTFRTLQDGRCVCKEPYYDFAQAVCGCSSSAYYFNESCLQCPQKCSRCYYNSTIKVVECITCLEANNRNESDENCSCLDGFIETIPASYFCYTRYCEFNQPHCSNCEGGRILDDQGLCVCPLGFYAFPTGCLPCRYPDCLKCDSKNTCSWCNEIQGYYLVGSTCIGVNTSNIILSQLSQGLILQIKLDQELGVPLDQSQKVTSTIYRIHKPNSTQILGQIPITVKVIRESSMIVTAVLQNPHEQVEDVIISLLFENPEQGVRSKTLNVKVAKLLSEPMIRDLTSSSFRYVEAVVILFMLLALITCLRGYKHNQVMFYIQTMSFLAYYLNNAQYVTAQFLFNLKVSYFKLIQGPFYKMIPTFYFQSSFGNFRWLTGDSNIIRVIDFPLLLCLITIGFFILIKLLYLIFVVKCNIDTRFIKFKKWFYRLFQFFFKSLMYPIVFFSFNTLLNTNSTVYMNIEFKHISIAVSVICLAFFPLFVTFLYCYLNMSKLYQIEMICQLVIDYCAALTLIKTLQYNFIWLPVFIVMIIAKDLTYFVLRQSIANEKDWVLYLQLGVIPIEVIPLIMIYLDYQYAIVGSIFISVIVQTIAQWFIIKRINRLAHFDKLKIKVQDEEVSAGIVIP